MPEKAPIEEYFPIEQVNEIADREASIAGKYYRPIYTIHKWWARRLGTVFRSILLYTLADEDMKVISTSSSDGKNRRLDTDFSQNDLQKKKSDWDGDPKTLWENFYFEDFHFGDKKILDPFMGGGTTIVEGLRTGCDVIGKDLNPIAWFITKKEVEPVDIDKLSEAFEALKKETSKKVRQYYRTQCPDCNGTADAMYFFWVREVDCQNCRKTIPLLKDHRIAKSRSPSVENKHEVICSSCNNSFIPGVSCPECGTEYEHGNYYQVQCPECKEIFESPKYTAENTCTKCNFKFNPKKDGYTSGKYFTCFGCGQKTEVLEAISEDGKPDQKMRALEYYCSNCDKKGYKKPQKRDVDLYQDARDKFEEISKNLPIPDQDIPEGHNTTVRNPVKRHGYTKFCDMFNKRQLLSLGLLIDQIQEIGDQNIKEYLLLMFSEHLKFNNLFCRYNKSKNQLSDIFRSHAFEPQNTPVEANVLGTEYGISLQNTFNKIIRAKKYCKDPYEKRIVGSTTEEENLNIKIESQITGSFNELLGDKKALLSCGDSSYLGVPNQSVDAIITDPPYFDNVMYSELSDFFYVWLQKCLNEDYDVFSSRYTPKTGEAVKNESRDKGSSDFTSALENVFIESSKKLKEGGLMVFTFHHGSQEAWASVLKSVLESGFYITAIYPIQAEMSSSMHVRGKGNIEYDMIMVCRKKEEEPARGIWNEMEDEIYLEAKEEIKKLQEGGRGISEGDMFVIAIGKCLEIYSKHYPNVVKDGEQVSVQEALDDINDIVDAQLMGGMFEDLVEELDTVSAAYITYIAGRGGEISYNSLNKNLQQRSVDIADLVNSKAVVKEGSSIKVPDLENRAALIEDKPEDKLNAIDRAFYLLYLKEQDRLNAEMHDWATDEALTALKKLGEKTDNNDYVDVAEFVEEKMADTKLDSF